MRKIIALTAVLALAVGLSGCKGRVAVGENVNAAGYDSTDMDDCMKKIDADVNSLKHTALKALTLTEYGDGGEKLDEINKSHSGEYDEYMVYDAVLGPDQFTKIKGYFVVSDDGVYSEGEWCLAKEENGEWEIVERKVGKLE